MRLPVRILLVSLLLALGAGCASLGSRIEAPEVRLVDLAPAGGGAFEQRLAVRLRLVNPNPFEIVVEGIDFELDVNDARLARVLGAPEAVVPAFGDAVVEVTASTTLLDLVRQVGRLADAQQLAYAIDGRIYVEGGPRRGIPFRYENRLDATGVRSTGETTP